MSEHKTEIDPSGVVFHIGAEEEAVQWIGRESKPVEEAYPIDVEHIEHFAEGIEDPNPLYWSDEFGKQTRWGGRIAPWGVVMLTMEHNVWRPAWMGERKGHDMFFFTVPLPGNRLLATDYEVECYEPMRPGDHIFKNEKLIDIIPKTFRIGVGHQMVVDTFYRNQKGELCVKDRRTVFRYRAPDSQSNS